MRRSKGHLFSELLACSILLMLWNRPPIARRIAGVQVLMGMTAAFDAA